MYGKLHFTGPGGQLVYINCEYEQGTQKSNHVLQIYKSER